MALHIYTVSSSVRSNQLLLTEYEPLGRADTPSTQALTLKGDYCHRVTLREPLHVREITRRLDHYSQ